MDRAASFFCTGRLEGIMIVLQELGEKEGLTRMITKEYVIQKLTELELTHYIDDIVNEYYAQEPKP